MRRIGIFAVVLLVAASGFTFAQSSSLTRVGCILGVGGLGDLSFNDLVYAGLQKAQKELGIQFDYVEPQSISDFETYLRKMASMKTYSVIISVGYDQVDPLTKVAPQFPGQKFAIIDESLNLPNVVSYVSKEEEGSFLVGALAGFLKKANTAKNPTIGFIAALDIPLLDKFYAGYEAGARYVNPSVKVIANYIGGNAPFSDITTAKEIALKQFNQGANIIYHAAGGSGLGVFQAAKEKNFYAIGVNSNQNPIDPNHIIASMLKRVDTAAYKIAAAAKQENLETGKTVILGLADGGIDYTVEGSKVTIDPKILKAVNDIKQSIVDGKLIVPDTHAKVEAFLKANTYK
ncbi:MAG: BMP family lipoprotein [Rectinema subterraneum]